MALHAGSELDAGLSREIGRHVSSCSSCSALLASLEAARADLAELKREAPAPGDYLAVRQAVHRRIDLESRDRGAALMFPAWSRLRVFALAASACCAILIAWYVMAQLPRTPKAPPVAVNPPVPRPSPPPEPVREDHTPPARAHRRMPGRTELASAPLQIARLTIESILPPVPAGGDMITPSSILPERWTAPGHTPATVVKLETGDPGVVIFWLIGTQGE